MGFDPAAAGATGPAGGTEGCGVDGASAGCVPLPDFSGGLVTPAAELLAFDNQRFNLFGVAVALGGGWEGAGASTGFLSVDFELAGPGSAA